MTRAPTQYAGRPSAILSWLLAVLALLLFGLPQGKLDAVATSVPPAAGSQIEQAQAILIAQRHFLHGPLAPDTSPDAAVPSRSDVVAPVFATGILLAPRQFLAPVAIWVLPPARGPPVA
jgi:hypothetical protein